jgi:hypothetical protein
LPKNQTSGGLQIVAKRLAALVADLFDNAEQEKDINLLALAEILEAVLKAVPMGVLEEIILEGLDSTVARRWREHMRCDLITPKVREVLHLLWMNRDKAREALVKVLLTESLFWLRERQRLAEQCSQLCIGQSVVYDRIGHVRLVCGILL